MSERAGLLCDLGMPTACCAEAWTLSFSAPWHAQETGHACSRAISLPPSRV